MGLGRFAGAVGKGMFAGTAGAAAMTVSSALEARLQQRESSTVPAQAVERVLHVVPESAEDEQRLMQLAHWGYGIAWGGVRGALAGMGVPRPLAALLHGVALWSSEQVMLPKLELSAPVTEWSWEMIATDGLHHVVYVLATDVAYARLDRG